MYLQAEKQLISRKVKRLMNRVTTRFGTPPTAYVQFEQQNIPIVHRGTFADIGVINQCFRDRQYDTASICGYPTAEVYSYYRKISDEGTLPLIVDCGANIGASALWFEAQFPTSQIVCIEPEPGNFALLQRNCRSAAYDLRQCGVGLDDGPAVLVDPGDGEWGYRTSSSGAGMQISIISLKTLREQKPASSFTPFILKIDIEGAERDLFEGDTSFIDSFPIIILEPHDWLLHGQETALGFFRFHVACRREIYIRGENLFSVRHDVLTAGSTFKVMSRV